MENVTRALILAFSMLMFVVGFAYSMFLINKLTATSNALIGSIATTNYYDNIEVTGENVTKREVGVDTIIPTLYRYYKETYAVKILDKDDTVIQLFDVNLESKIAKAAAYTKNDNQEMTDLKKSIYNNNGNKFVSGVSFEKAYMFEAPWIGNTEDYTRSRIDYFLNGTKGYINDTLVDYESTIGEGGFLGQYGDKIFEESFVEYAYDGQTISTENGLETITGNVQENNKIIITYKVKE